MAKTTSAAKFYNQFWKKTLSRFEGSAGLLSLWMTEGWSPGKWSEKVVKILVQTAKECFEGQGIEVVAKNSPDKKFHRSEYFNIDLIAYQNDPDNWRKPVLALEHENSQDEDWLAYCIWKLLSIDCDYRILFAYPNPKATVQVQNPEQLEKLIKDALKHKDHRGKSIMLITGTWYTEARRGRGGWNNALHRKIIK